MSITHNSLASLQDSVHSLVRDGNLETALEMIQAFVEPIAWDPLVAGRVFSAPALDELCLSVGAQVLSQMNLVSQVPIEGRIVYVATEFYRTGGHTLVAADFVRNLPDHEHVFLLTDVLSNLHPDAPDLRLVPLGAKVERASPGPKLEKLKWLLKRIFELAPSKMYWFNHHQDAVAIAAALPSIPGSKCFVHHGDYNLCLGVHLPHLHHVDLTNIGFFNCRNRLGIADNRYWPLVCDDLGPRDRGCRFIRAGWLRTCSSGSPNKFEIPYLYDYVDVLVRILSATGGDHIHIGCLSEEYLNRVHRQLAEANISQERFVHVPWVPSLWRALIEREVDVYLMSWPIGGGKALIEAMGAGIPAVIHTNYISRYHSGFDVGYADAPLWRTPTELVDLLCAFTSESLAFHSLSARSHYEMHHTPKILASRLRGEAGDGPAPILLRDYYPDSLQTYLDERAQRNSQIANFTQRIAERDGQIASLNQVVAERDGQIASLKQSVFDLTSELRGLQAQITTILRSKSWRVTMPFREVSRWIDAPRVQSKRYVKAVLRRLKRMYQAVPLSLQTKALHHNWIARHAPRLLFASGSYPTAKAAIGISPSVQTHLFPIESRVSVRSEPLEETTVPAGMPVVSVIIPVCGKIDHTLRCLKSIESNPPGFKFEVILVGDSSLNNSDVQCLKAPDVHLVINAEASGFIHCCNMGAKAAHGQYLMFLNNDNEVMPGWTDRFLRIFDECSSKARVRIAAVTMVYNEALILPYFLRHYQYLDVIYVLYETDTTDESLEILMRAPNVVIKKGHIEGGLDDIAKIALINSTVQTVKADWVYVVDADELIFPPNNESPHNFLKRQSYDVVRSGMYQVYRHRNDKDLNPSLTPVPQRTHGDPDLFSTDQQANRASNSLYIKPNIVRPSKRFRFLPGHHQIEGDPKASSELYVGAHWQMADPSFALARRMERKARISERNRVHQMGWQHFDVSVEKIKEECLRHQDYPEIDALRTFSEVPVQDLFSAGRSDNPI